MDVGTLWYGYFNGLPWLILQEKLMEERDHFDIVDFIESIIEPQEAVKEADDSIEDDIEPISF